MNPALIARGDLPWQGMSRAVHRYHRLPSVGKIVKHTAGERRRNSSRGGTGPNALAEMLSNHAIQTAGRRLGKQVIAGVSNTVSSQGSIVFSTEFCLHC